MHDTGCLGLVHWDNPEGWYEEGGGRRIQEWELKYIRGRFMLMYGKNQYSIVKKKKKIKALGYLHVCVCVCSEAQSCLTLFDPMDCCLPGSSVHGILPVRMLEWVTTFSSR